MRLTDLEPRWYAVRVDERHGITFGCPHCAESGQRLAIALHMDGTNFDADPTNPQQFAADENVWTVASGDSFENLTLTPSVDASKAGHWHGHITNGEIVGGLG